MHTSNRLKQEFEAVMMLPEITVITVNMLVMRITNVITVIVIT